MSPVLYYGALVLFGMLPSLVWLFFYLRKDCHPEPKYLIADTFLLGIILSPLAVILQLMFVQASLKFFPLVEPRSITFFLWAAFVEEFIKFYAVKLLILHNPEFDEPVDAMIYMITAGLGFAAMENILTLFSVLYSGGGVNLAFNVWVLRFVGAVLLHALSSGIVGYFVAMAWFYRHHHKKFIVMGLFLSTIFHFTFNMLLSSDNQAASLVYTTILLIVMAFLVSILFDKIKDRDIKSSVALA